jgi:hypothetical protein
MFSKKFASRLMFIMICFLLLRAAFYLFNAQPVQALFDMVLGLYFANSSDISNIKERLNVLENGEDDEEGT